MSDQAVETATEFWDGAQIRLGERLARIEALVGLLVRRTEPQEDS